MQPAIAAGGSLLLAVLLNLLCFRLGISVGSVHWLILPGLYLAVLWLLCVFFGSPKGVFESAGWESAYYIVFFVVAIVLSRWVIATDFDGLFMHVEFVRAIAAGWNPVLDPRFEQFALTENVAHLDMMGAKVLEGGFYVKYGQILQSNLVPFWGHEAAKAVNWFFAYFLFRAALALFHLLHQDVRKSAVCGLLVVLNPVILYQIPSFKHDAMVAASLSVMILSGIVFLRTRKVSALVLYLIASILLVGVKKSGVAYTAFFSAFYLFFFVLEVVMNGIKKPLFVISGFVLVALSITSIFAFGLFDFRPDIQFPFANTLAERGRLETKVKPASIFNDYPEYRDLNGFEQFLMTSFSESNATVMHPEWKIPGEISKREIENLYQAFTGYWIGGMGPLFSLALVLGLFAVVTGLVVEPGKALWVIYLFMPILWSVCLLPSLWLRWVPQVWLLCMGWMFFETREFTGFKLFSLRGWGSLARVFYTVCVSVLFCNAALVAGMTAAGQLNISRILNAQFALISQLSEPVSASFDWFPSNRYWFSDRQIPFEVVSSDSNEMKPFFHLYRTNTRVFLEENQRTQLVKYPGVAGPISLENALLRLEETLSEDAYTWHWIPPIHVME